jgi:hypothetical protein
MAITRWRGLNVAGAEFGETMPGTYDVDYHYDSQATFDYLASRGHRLVRLPFKWERVQRTLGGALDATEMSRLTACINRIGAAGMVALLDVHNYARYKIGSTTHVIGGGTVTYQHLVDLWERLSDTYRNNGNVWGYGLMNEPHDMPSLSVSGGGDSGGGFTSNRLLYSFDSTVTPWGGESDSTSVSRITSSPTPHSGSGAMAVTRSAGLTNALGQQIRAGDNSGANLTSADGTTLSAWVYVPTSASGTWQARLELQNESYAYVPGPDVAITKGVWTQVTYTPTAATWTTPRAIVVQATVDNPTSSSATFYVDTVQQGTISGGGGGGGFIGSATGGSRYWEQISQTVLDAIRARGDNKLVVVPGYQWSGAQNWTGNHPTPWIVDSANNFIYEAHYYPNSNNDGFSWMPYSTEASIAISQGHASITAKQATQVGNFTGWLATHGLTGQGIIGEYGVPKGDSNWQALAAAMYSLANNADLDFTWWSAGEWWPGYELNPYGGSPHSSTTNLATGVLELSANLSVDDGGGGGPTPIIRFGTGVITQPSTLSSAGFRVSLSVTRFGSGAISQTSTLTSSGFSVGGSLITRTGFGTVPVGVALWSSGYGVSSTATSWLGGGLARVVVDGVALNTFAHAITERSGLTVSPGLVGENARVPGRDGALYRARKRYDEGRMVLDLLVSNSNSSGAGASEAVFRSNLDSLLRIFGKRHSLVEVVKYDDAGFALVNDGEVQTVLAPEFSGTNPVARLRVEFTFPDPLWRDYSGAVTVPDHAPSSDVSTYALTSLGGGTAPISDATVVVVGPASSVTLTDTVSGAWVRLNRALSSGEAWRVNVATFESVVGSSTLGFTGGTVANVLTSTSFGPGPRFLPLTPSTTGSISLGVNAPGRTAATRVRVRATRRFLA